MNRLLIIVLISVNIQYNSMKKRMLEWKEISSGADKPPDNQVYPVCSDYLVHAAPYRFVTLRSSAHSLKNVNTFSFHHLSADDTISLS